VTLTINPKGREGKVMHLLMFHLLCRGKWIVHPLELPFVLVDVVWVKHVLAPNWSFGSTVLFVMGGFMYPVDKCFFYRSRFMKSWHMCPVGICHGDGLSDL
jgi:hypothetical protein